MRAKTISVLIILLGFNQIIFGQLTDEEAKLRNKSNDTIPGWKKGGVIGLRIAQTSLTNWASGGENSLALNGLLSVYANYKKDKIVWDNSLDVGYGLLKQGKNSDFMKSDDKFDFLSKYGQEAFTDFYYAALLNFKTQMSEGKDYASDTSKISNFLAPAYTTIAIGLDYKPNSYTSVFFAPITGKITLVNDPDLADAGAFGTEPAIYDSLGTMIQSGDKTRNEFGGYIRAIYSRNDFKNELLKNVAFTTKIDLFSNYLNNPQNIDVSWETQVALKINKFLSVNINFHLIYDDDIDITVDNNADGVIDETGPRVQFKEILGVGISYNF